MRISVVHSENASLLLKGLAAFAVVLLPPLLFEKYTFYLYLTDSPNFFGYSGSRFWFDIGYFALSGALSALVVGRRRWESIFPPVFGAAAFVISTYVSPVCPPRECYVSSTDGLGSIRDFLIFTSLGVLAANAVLSSRPWRFRSETLSRAYQFSMGILMSYALSFFPLVHILAGVSVPYPLNYVQWFLASAVPGFAGSFVVTERARITGIRARRLLCLLGGILGVLAGLVLDASLPCEACSNYEFSVGSILLVTLASSALGVGAGALAVPTVTTLEKTRAAGFARVAMTLIIVGTVVLLIGFYYSVSYTATVMNTMGPNVQNNNFSPLEVGSTFVYSGGYLATPEVRPPAVGVSVDFMNSSIGSSPSNFLAAGVGDQSPNCCTDGIDLAYRADAVLFSNGTEALLARTWWACDVNMACGGYSWQQLLHFGEYMLPTGTLSNLVDLRMNWTSPTLIGWYYRVHYAANGTTTPWIIYNSFVPPKIDNHYFDAGQCCGDVLFLQFGISSARAVTSNNWGVVMSCPSFAVGGNWTCLEHAGFVGGDRSLWKIVYTWGESYSGLDFKYLGNYTVEFFYSGSSPSDGTVIW